MNKVFLSLVLIHFINDFIFQSDELVKEKRKYKLSSHLCHSFLGSFITLILLLIIQVYYLIAIGIFLVLSFCHLGIDYMKIYLDDKKYKLKEGIILRMKDLFLFLLDQVLHLGLIYLISRKFIGKDIYFFNENIILILLFYILGTYFSSVLIVKFLDIIYYPEKEYKDKLPKDEKENESIKVGKYIGILERSFVLIIYFFSKDKALFLSAITVLLAIKSITRFKLLDKKCFAEYYLLGSLLSYTCVLLDLVLYNFIIK